MLMFQIDTNQAWFVHAYFYIIKIFFGCISEIPANVKLLSCRSILGNVIVFRLLEFSIDQHDDQPAKHFN